MGNYRLAMDEQNGVWALSFAREALVPMTETFADRKACWLGAKSYLDTLSPDDSVTIRIGERTAQGLGRDAATEWLREQWKPYRARS